MKNKFIKKVRKKYLPNPLHKGGKKRLTQEEFINRANAVHGNKYDYSDTVYISSNAKVKIICPRHGEFMQSPNQHLSGCGCKECSQFDRTYRKKLTKEEFIKKANEKHNYFYNYDKVNYINTSKKVVITCPKHGDFEQMPFLHYHAGNICPKCADENQRMTLNEFLERSRSIHGNTYDYSLIKDFNDGTNTIVKIICKKHGPFDQEARVHISGCGCKKCFDDKYRSNAEAFIKRAKEVHGDRYLYDKVVYVNNKTPVIVTCLKHGDFKVRPDRHLHAGNGCKKCSISKGENRIALFLKRKEIPYISEYFLPETPKEYPKVRYDFYLPEAKILIEFDGIQHFNKSAYELLQEARGKGHDSISYEKRVEYDKLKNKLAKANGYILIRVPYLVLNTVEEFLAKRLLDVYKYWIIVDSKLCVYKTFYDLAKSYNLPDETTENDVLDILEKVIEYKLVLKNNRSTLIKFS